MPVQVEPSASTQLSSADLKPRGTVHPSPDDWDDSELRDPPQDQSVPVQHEHGRATVRIDLPPAGMAILA